MWQWLHMFYDKEKYILYTIFKNKIKHHVKTDDVDFKATNVDTYNIRHASGIFQATRFHELRESFECTFTIEINHGIIALLIKFKGWEWLNFGVL